MPAMRDVTKNASIRIIQTNSGTRFRVMPGARIVKMVTIKFMPVATEPIGLLQTG